MIFSISSEAREYSTMGRLYSILFSSEEHAYNVKLQNVQPRKQQTECNILLCIVAGSVGYANSTGTKPWA